MRVILKTNGAIRWHRQRRRKCPSTTPTHRKLWNKWPTICWLRLRKQKAEIGPVYDESESSGTFRWIISEMPHGSHSKKNSSPAFLTFPSLPHVGHFTSMGVLSV